MGGDERGCVMRGCVTSGCDERSVTGEGVL